VRRWARVHGVCMNDLQKSGPKPRWFTTFFCHLFLL
jgi:hypothetical protein